MSQEPLIDVPDDFDLQAAKYARSSTDSKKRKRCPYCFAVNPVPRAGKSVHEFPAPEADYRCKGCGSMFDKPLVISDDEDPRDPAADPP